LFLDKEGRDILKKKERTGKLWNREIFRQDFSRRRGRETGAFSSCVSFHRREKKEEISEKKKDEEEKASGLAETPEGKTEKAMSSSSGGTE